MPLLGAAAQLPVSVHPTVRPLHQPVRTRLSWCRHSLPGNGFVQPQLIEEHPGATTSIALIQVESPRLSVDSSVSDGLDDSIAIPLQFPQYGQGLAAWRNRSVVADRRLLTTLAHRGQCQGTRSGFRVTAINARLLFRGQHSGRKFHQHSTTRGGGKGGAGLCGRLRRWLRVGRILELSAHRAGARWFRTAGGTPRPAFGGRAGLEPRSTVGAHALRGTDCASLLHGW